MKRYYHNLRLSLMVLLLGLFFQNSRVMAFVPSQAGAEAMTDAWVVNARGVQTVGWNPAFLGFSDNKRFSLYTPLLNANWDFRNSFFSLGLVKDYFQEDKYLTQADKQSIINEIDDDYWDIAAKVYAPILGISFPTEAVNMAFTIELEGNASLGLSDEFVQLMLNGHSENDTAVTRFFKASNESSIFLKYSLSTAKRFKTIDSDWFDEITAGFTFSYYSSITPFTNAEGVGFTKVHENEMTLFTSHDSLLGDGWAEVSLAGDNTSGNGLGLDIGVGAKALDNRLTMGISAINLINTIHWVNLERRRYSFYIDKPIDFNDFDNEDFFDENFNTLDTTYLYDEEYEQKIPSYLMFSGGYQLTPSLLLAGNIRQMLNDTPIEPMDTKLSFGVKYDPIKQLPLYTGFAVGTDSKTALGMGFGLHFGSWVTDIGWKYKRGLFYGSKGFSVGINTVFFFGKPGFLSQEKEKTKPEKKKKPVSHRRKPQI